MERISKVRAVLLLLLICAVIGLYSLRLFRLQIIDTDGNTDNTTYFLSITRVKASRGDILDRNGNILIGNRASYDLVFNHNVITSSKGTNDSLYRLVKKCEELGVTYIDHFPITKTRPYEYTLDDYTTAWRRYFQNYVRERSIDSDITAPLLMQKLRERYKIPDTWTDDEARAVIGLRYEFDLRGVANLPNYIFIEDVSDSNLSAILELNTPGLMVESSTVREYHTSYAAHILGTMGSMDEAQWASYKEKMENGTLEPDSYTMDAQIGQSGFEAAFEEYLHGIDGVRVDKVAKDGSVISQEYKYDSATGKSYAPRAGNNVETTIDLNLQIVAEDALADVIAYLKDPEQNTSGDGSDVEGAAVVVMKVKTGEILACASYPTYDLQTYNEKYDEITQQDFDPLFNRAFHASYPPGSTFKMSTLIAAMMAGKYEVGEIITDEGVFTKYDGFSPTCLVYSAYGVTHGDLTAQKALEVSCNYFFYVLADRITIDQLDATSKALGLGEPTGIELNEDIGHRANAESKALTHTGLEASWFTGDRIQAGIGQSENKFSPLQLCVYACTLANQGVRYKATFLNRVVSADYHKLVEENTPKVVSTLDIPDYIYQTYLEGMVNVVKGTEGTARNTMRGTAVSVAAKTGTAQHGLGKNASDHGAFVCFAPVEDPEIAIAVYGEKAAHGSTLGQVAKTILNVYFSADDKGDVITYENNVG